MLEEEPAGPGGHGQLAGGAEGAGWLGTAASRMLFLATRSPGVLSFTHLFIPGLRGR